MASSHEIKPTVTTEPLQGMPFWSRMAAIIRGEKDRESCDQLSYTKHVAHPWELHARPNDLQIDRSALLRTSVVVWLIRRHYHNRAIATCLIIASVSVCLTSWCGPYSPFELPNVFADVMLQPLRIVGCLSTLVGIYLLGHLINKDLFHRQLHTFETYVIIWHWSQASVALLILYHQIYKPTGILPIVISVASACVWLAFAVIISTLDALRIMLRTKVCLLGALIIQWFCFWLALKWHGLFFELKEAEDNCFFGITCENVKRTAASDALYVAIFLMKSLLQYINGNPLAIIRPHYDNALPRASDPRHPMPSSSESVCASDSTTKTKVNSFGTHASMHEESCGTNTNMHEGSFGTNTSIHEDENDAVAPSTVHQPDVILQDKPSLHVKPSEYRATEQENRDGPVKLAILYDDLAIIEPALDEQREIVSANEFAIQLPRQIETHDHGANGRLNLEANLVSREGAAERNQQISLATQDIHDLQASLDSYTKHWYNKYQ